MRSQIFRSLSFLLVISIVGPARGSLIVSVNNYSVTAGTPIVAQLLVSNSSAAAVSEIEGMTLTVQLAAGTASAPKITALDVLSSTIWAGHVSAANASIPPGGNQLQYQSRDIITDNAGDFVDANGLLATATIDTTGAAVGTYSIKLIGTMTAGRDSEFLNALGDPVAATFGEGLITINLPEPSGLLLTATALSVLTMVAVVRGRRKNVLVS